MTAAHPAFLNAFVQLGYVTSDLDRAIHQYARHGVSKFLTFDTRISHPNVRHHVRVGLAWTGPIMVELIEPLDANELYAHALPVEGFGIQLHHTGYLVEDDAQFAEAVAWAEAQQLPIASRGYNEGVLEVLFADARQTMGHHLEIIHLFEKGREMFQAVPKN
jgi:hypothetical protein